ncbi:MAG: polyprenyl synthetase family protein [Candidatus Binatia bacterium]|nr:polyprenyl synthetase family protein [Candidatus Binatia bacterium]
MTGPQLEKYLTSRRREIDVELGRCVAPSAGRPPSLVRAMRYAVLGPGKRLRPVLAVAAAEAVSGARARKKALRPGCAIEMIHAYSLAHDDLPAMDDDDMRRGRPSVHAKFGEAAAILAGDALLTDAFAVAAGARASDAPQALAVVSEIAAAAGSAGMVGGQVKDIDSEGKRRVGLAAVQTIHRLKTGALLRASVRVGALAAGAEAKDLRSLTTFGEAFGLVFQITDDVLDEVGDFKTLGKPAGGDKAAGKATYPGVLGLDGARREARRVAQEGYRAIEGFGRRGAALESLLRHVVDRAA